MPGVEQSSISALSEGDLRSGFASFVEAAQRLETSYAALKARAAEIDVQLARANAKLADTLQERETLLLALPVGVVALGTDGVVRWSNPEADRILALGASHDIDFARAKAGLHELEDVTVAVARVALQDGGGMTVLEDRSKVTNLEREVDRLDRLAGLSELALGVAHEIKNPLNGVMGFAALLERHEDPDQIRRCARKVSAGMREVDAIVKGMLAFARPDAGASTPTGSVREAILAAASEAGVSTERLACAGDLDCAVERSTLTRVLANLLRNATEAGAHRVSIQAEREGPQIVIDVEDDGPGIAPEVTQRLFEPFVSSKPKGHGLGLALAARVLSFLGGGIEYSPGEGGALRGARFRVKMPCEDRVASLGGPQHDDV